jgi:hypothetical protein
MPKFRAQTEPSWLDDASRSVSAVARFLEQADGH